MPRPLDRRELLNDPTLTGRSFVAAYTTLVDEWIAEVYDEAVGDRRGLALVATGGHGRAELAPQSDLDLLLLHDGSFDADAAQQLWYPIWDAGFKLGHSVRTSAETLALARDDLATATSLLSPRLLAGDPAVFATLRDSAKAQWRKQSGRVLHQLSEAVEARHATFGDVAAALEPDLKEGRGGLRDVHALSWILAAQPDLAIIRPESLHAEYDLLLAVRVELHRTTGRAGDTLTFQDQDEVAARLGAENADVLLTEMGTAARRIAWASDEAWFEVQANLRSGLLRRASRRRTVAPGVDLVAGRVELSPEDDVDELSVLRVAAAAATHRARIARSTLDRLRTAPQLPDPWPAEARRLFVELLQSGTPAICVIEALDLTDLWLPLVPEWEPNRSRPQRNAYHRFAIDRHLLECVANTSLFTEGVARGDLLVMGALLHDIGKGYPGEHSISGIEIGAAVMRRIGFPEPDVEIVKTMIEHHLLLPDVATRRDLDDPATILSVAARVQTTETLRLLDALTKADSLATGPMAWSPWKEGLMATLVERTAFVTEGGDAGAVIPPAPATDHQQELQRRSVATNQPVIDTDGDRITVVCPDRPGIFYRVAGVLALNGLDVLEATVQTSDGVATEQFRVSSAFGSTIAWSKVERDLERAFRGRLALEPRLYERSRTYQRRRINDRGFEPSVRVLDNESSDGATVVEVLGPDSVGLLYGLTRALSDLDLDILRAKVTTMGTDVVDSFYVRDRSGASITDDADGAEIRTALLHVLSQSQI